MEQKLNEENIENNILFCIDPRKAFAIKSIPRSVFRNPSHKNKIYQNRPKCIDNSHFRHFYFSAKIEERVRHIRQVES